MDQNLIITEIYSSVQGESSFTGWPCVFVRLTGCPLRCRWCDTVYGFEGGNKKTFADILKEIESSGIKLVELTGGEPLAQPNSKAFMNFLVEKGYKVLIETGGSESIAQIPSDVHIIMDVKCPGSGMDDRNHLENLSKLKPTDEIKFVIANKSDFDWSIDFIARHQLENKINLLFSPAWGLCKPDELVSWLLKSGVNARLNLQIHKYIWSPKKKGV